MAAQPIIARVSGLTCQHCVNHVTEELTELPQVDRVEVELHPEEVSLVSIFVADGATLSRQEIAEAIDEAGDYTLEDVSA